MPLILAIDVGNTRAKFGMFETGAAERPQAVNLSACRLDTNSSLASGLQRWLDDHAFDDIGEAIVAGSNPPVRNELIAAWPDDLCKPTIIEGHAQIPVPMDVQHPETVGIDRLLTAFAARQMISNQSPIVIIDSGTATTVNLLTSDGTFRGGAILPGLRLSAHALHDYTARLPLIDTDQICAEDSDDIDAPLPGRQTVDAMKSGLFWGQLGAVKELTARLSDCATQKFGDTKSPVLVLTGGGGRQLVSQLNNAVYVDCLALHGLAMLPTDYSGLR